MVASTTPAAPPHRPRSSSQQNTFSQRRSHPSRKFRGPLPGSSTGDNNTMKKLAEEEKNRRVEISRELDRRENMKRAGAAERPRGESRGKSKGKGKLRGGQKMKRRTQEVEKQQQQQQQQQDQQEEKNLSRIPRTPSNVELAALIRSEVQSWDSEINSLPSQDVAPATRILTTDFTDPSYSAKYGYASLVAEFGNDPGGAFGLNDDKTGDESGGGNVITMAARDRNQMLKEVGEANKILFRKCVDLRRLMRKFDGASTGIGGDHLEELKKCYLDSGKDLEMASGARKSNKRSSEVLEATVRLARMHMSAARNADRTGGSDDSSSDSDSDSDRYSEDDDAGKSPKLRFSNDGKKSICMASPVQLVSTANREDRQHRKTLRKTIKKGINGSNSNSPTAAPRRLVPFHLQEDQTKRIQWLKTLCGVVATKTVLHANEELKELERTIVVKRAEVKSEKIREEHVAMRRRSRQLVKEVQVAEGKSEQLTEENQALQKDLNISIKRYTTLNKGFAEKEKKMKMEMAKMKEARDFLQAEKKDFFRERDHFKKACNEISDFLKKQSNDVVRKFDGKVAHQGSRISRLEQVLQRVADSIKESKNEIQVQRKSIIFQRETIEQLEGVKEELVKAKDDLRRLSGAVNSSSLKDESDDGVSQLKENEKAEHAARSRTHTVGHSGVSEVMEEIEKAEHAARSRTHTVGHSGVSELIEENEKAEHAARRRTHTVGHSGVNELIEEAENAEHAVLEEDTHHQT